MKRRAIRSQPFLWVSKKFVTKGALRELKGSELKTYLALCCAESWDYVGVNTLCKYTGLTERSIHRALRTLADKSLISIDSGKEKGQVNEYEIAEFDEGYDTGVRGGMTHMSGGGMTLVSDNEDPPYEHTTKKTRGKPKGSPDPSKQKKVEPFDIECADILKAHVLGLKGLVSPAKLEKWVDVFRKMREIDKRSVSDIKAWLRFAITDEFWGRNILSADKFRLRCQEGKIQGAMGVGKSNATEQEREKTRKLIDKIKSEKEAANGT